jgi:hypothetical protein
MTLFSQSFFSVLIFCALLLTGAGAVVLLGLLVRDIKKGKVW